MHIADDIKWRQISLWKDAKLMQADIAQPYLPVRSVILIHAPYLAYL